MFQFRQAPFVKNHIISYRFSLIPLMLGKIVFRTGNNALALIPVDTVFNRVEIVGFPAFDLDKYNLITVNGDYINFGSSAPVIPFQDFPSGFRQISADELLPASSLVQLLTSFFGSTGLVINKSFSVKRSMNSLSFFGLRPLSSTRI